MSGWLPIETAPRDGTAVLVYAAEGDLGQFSQRMAVGVFRDVWDGPEHDPVRVMFSYFELWENGRVKLDYYFRATHWMPLPEAPTEGACDG